MEQRLLEFIHKKGWNNAEFARRMGIMPQSVSSYLNGKLNIQKLFVKLYENGCDINWLISGESGNLKQYEFDYSKLSNMYKNSNDSILLRLNDTIKRHNIDIEAIANKSGLNSKFIKDMLLGNIAFRIELAYIIAEACDFSFVYFATGIGREYDNIETLEANNNIERIYELKGQIKLLKELLLKAQYKSQSDGNIYTRVSQHKLASEPKVR